jgi:predicted metal-binding protein
LACPPYAPSPEKFRKIVSEYRFALFMKFRSQAEGDGELIKYLTKTDDTSVSQEMRVRVESFWSAWKDDMKKVLDTVIKLEKAAAGKGYLLAIGLVSGSCLLCEE